MSERQGFTPASKQASVGRRAGILLHPTSFPSRHGIGDFGPMATRFLDFLAAAGATLWQTLPLGPVGFGNSPYAARSAFAGNPLLISLERVAELGLLPPDELAALPLQAAGFADYETAERHKMRILHNAFDRFVAAGRSGAFAAFCSEERAWLIDWAAFAALSERVGKQVWTAWEPAISRRVPGAVERWSWQLESEIEFQQFLQWLFFTQWDEVRRQAHERGIAIVGDLPIFVSHDSADVWARPELFKLDDAGNPAVVAGVPPDYFAKTGQRWGHPLYRWNVLEEEGYEWWRERMRMMLRQFDMVRIDHFRGFVDSWEIPAEEETAVNGEWVSGPGRKFFDTLEASLGRLPIIVEDLGIITHEVGELRDELGYPGMKVLQFAFDSGPDNPFLPFSYHSNTVVYTGTHDNDTTRGWYDQAPHNVRNAVRRYCASDGRDISWDLIRIVLGSVADLAIVPLQDVLGLNSISRMNFPGTAEGNWRWRYQPDDLQPWLAARFRDLAEIYGRLPDQRPD